MAASSDGHVARVDEKHGAKHAVRGAYWKAAGGASRCRYGAIAEEKGIGFEEIVRICIPVLTDCQPSPPGLWEGGRQTEAAACAANPGMGTSSVRSPDPWHITEDGWRCRFMDDSLPP